MSPSRRLGIVLFAGVMAAAALLPAGAQQLRIGFVNAAKILENAPQADQARERLEQEFAPRDEELVAMQRELRAQEEKLTREAVTLSDAGRRDIEREILRLKRELKRAEDEFREDLNIRRNEEFAKLRQLVIETINRIGRSEGFDIILNEGAVVYRSDRVDITPLVVERLQAGGEDG